MVSIIISKFIEYSKDFVFIKSISMIESKGSEIDCIIIVIAQTEEGVAVKDDNNSYSYYFRKAEKITTRN